jgi:hypothetical protein
MSNLSQTVPWLAMIALGGVLVLWAPAVFSILAGNGRIVRRLLYAPWCLRVVGIVWITVGLCAIFA